MFLSVAIILRERKGSTVVKTELILYFWKELWFATRIKNSSSWTKVLSESTTVKMKSVKYYSNSRFTIESWKYLYNNNNTFVSPFYTFSLAGNIIVYTAIQGANREKYFIHTINQEKMPTLAGKNTFPSTSPLIGRVLSIFWRKKNWPIP